jgi:hypothetical protein
MVASGFEVLQLSIGNNFTVKNKSSFSKCGAKFFDGVH